MLSLSLSLLLLLDSGCCVKCIYLYICSTLNLSRMVVCCRFCTTDALARARAFAGCNHLSGESARSKSHAPSAHFARRTTHHHNAAYNNNNNTTSFRQCHYLWYTYGAKELTREYLTRSNVRLYPRVVVQKRLICVDESTYL